LPDQRWLGNQDPFPESRQGSALAVCSSVIQGNLQLGLAVKAWQAFLPGSRDDLIQGVIGGYDAMQEVLVIHHRMASKSYLDTIWQLFPGHP